MNEDDHRPGASEDTNSALLKQVRRRAGSAQRWLRDGDPSLARQFAAVGVLGWIIVIPALLGVWLGRWLDNWLSTGITFTAALLLLGLLLGGWSAWRWMHEP
ncbi:AtpZ/AtpI family protein [Hydrogenophaga sp. PAMC20947]|uniref:AtpZ/AtpI family protein n=1 Tax=Hydrogenophaga sp. PAMC20947 TaxID=2565558 RepID=UPI00109DA7DA|nr:AtpZ/AtpI family protein [Hydrogenophaga sp. PAMC20947]QCB48148.1 AtpZ/AtpI family protein [Hydrogenophaga sp. PAMC20947]